MIRPLFIYIILAMGLSAIPFISWPFNWVETFFHEISHGAVAMMTGGDIEKIVIRINGSGLCVYQGGNRFLTAFAGYPGAIVVGSLIYVMAKKLNKSANIISVVMMGLVLLTLVLWARDIITIVILLVLLALFYAALSEKLPNYFNKVEQFIGIYVLVNALRSPIYLFDGRHSGDGATLSDITRIPEFLWVAIWVCTGLMAIYLIWKSEKKHAV